VTNQVAMTLSANVLIAAGASPIMALAPEEAGELAATSAALVVNMGTLTREWIAGATPAIEGARGNGRPWVLDPVGVGASAFRRGTAADLLTRRPRVVRGNASEILALGGGGGAGKGVDSTHGADAAADAAVALAARLNGVVAVTGAVDLVTDGRRVLRVENGHELLTRTTASGCALTALVGAWLAVLDDPLEATAGALAAYGIAAELAAQEARGCGSFVPALLDALGRLDGATATRMARLA
jgi:hydroxyethylthiazole kinase